MEVSGRNETARAVLADVRSRSQRSMTRPFFSKDRISDFEIFDRHADQVVLKMKERFKEGIAVDVQDILSRFTLDTATEFLFGQDVNSLSADLPYPSTCKRVSSRTHPSDEFAFAFNRAQERMFLRVMYGKSWPLVDFWEDIVAKDKKTINKFTDVLPCFWRRSDSSYIRLPIIFPFVSLRFPSHSFTSLRISWLSFLLALPSLYK